jgi:hypothetical protein
VLEGPRLEPAELALGQGWSNAERSARGVTRELLASAAGALGASGGGSAAARSPAVALLAESPAAERSARALLAALRLEGAAWAPLRAAILTRAPDGGPLPAAVLIALDAQPQDGGDDAGWWLDVGLALGAFGPRAVVALAPGRAAPAAVRDAGAVTLDPAHAAALGVRLRAAGISV